MKLGNITTVLLIILKNLKLCSTYVDVCLDRCKRWKVFVKPVFNLVWTQQHMICRDIRTS